MRKRIQNLPFGKEPDELLHAQCTRLRCVAGEREVFVFTDLLGPAVPVCRGLEACAPFCMPWAEARHIRYINGRIGLCLPMIAVLAMGCGPMFVEQLRKTPCSRLKGARWPHCALLHIADKNPGRAEKILRAGDKWLAHTAVEWTEAAYYWARLLNNRKMAKHCLEIASGIDESPKHDFLCTRFWAARGWVELLDARERVFRWLIREMEADDSAGWIMAIRCARLAEMWAWLGERDAAAACLRRAEKNNSPGWGYITAMQWDMLLDEREQAERVVEKAKNEPDEDEVSAGPMFWTCVPEIKDQARMCLENAEKQDSKQGYLITLAEAWLLHFNDRGRARHILQRAEQTEHENGLLHVYAKAAMTLLGDRSHAEIALLEAAVKADETALLLPVATTYLDVMHDEEACRKCLGRAQDLAGGACDLILCGTTWMELLGDCTRAAECLHAAKARAKNMIQETACLATAMRMFGDRLPKRLLHFQATKPTDYTAQPQPKWERTTNEH